MTFVSLSFLYYFLPVVVGVSCLLPRGKTNAARNWFLLGASVFFCLWTRGWMFTWPFVLVVILQAAAYVVGVCRREIKPRKNPVYLALYLVGTPWAVGPMMPYPVLEQQLLDRENTVPRCAEGLRRLVWGLCQKVILADTLWMFSQEVEKFGETGVVLAWVRLAAATWLHQPQSYSPVENRGMAWFLDWSNVTKAHFSEDFETHIQDQFPLRNQFRQGKALVELYALGQRDVDGVYETGGWMAELEYPQRTGMLDHVAQKIQWVYDHYLAGTDATCYLSVVPDKHYYLSQTNGYPALDYDGLIQSLRAQVPAMPYIDLTDLLSLDDYYRTDSHWRQEKILPVAQRLAETMGATIDGPEVYAPQRFNRAFVGRYAVQMGLTMEHDTLTYLTSPTLHQCYTVVYDQMGRPQRGKVYEVAYGHKNYPYVMFLSGSKGLIQLTNLKAPADKNLILFRDSFGSSLAPLLASGYRTITLVDLRYITSAELGKYLEVTDQDVLFLYSTLLLNNSMAMR